MPLNWLKEQKQKLQDEVNKFRNKDFMEATVAACALVAAADGSISSAEKQKMMGFIQQNDALKVFKTQDVIAAFNDMVAKFEFDSSIGKAEALAKIGKLRSKPDAARLCVRVCCAVAASDGSFDESERRVVREICTDLGLNPADFEL